MVPTERKILGHGYDPHLLAALDVDPEDRMFWLRAGRKARRSLAARYAALAAYRTGEVTFEAAIELSGASRATFAKLNRVWKSTDPVRDLLPSRAGRPPKEADRWPEARRWAAHAAVRLAEMPVDRVARLAAAELGPSPPIAVLRSLIRRARRLAFVETTPFTIVAVDQVAVDLALVDGGHAVVAMVVDVPTALTLGFAVAGPELIGANAQAARDVGAAADSLRTCFGVDPTPPRVEAFPDHSDPISMVREVRRLGEAGAAVRTRGRVGGLLLDLIGDGLGDLPFRPGRTGVREPPRDEDASPLTVEEAREVVAYEVGRRNRGLLASLPQERFARRELVPSFDALMGALRAIYPDKP
jgi:hypothetical protein